MRRTAADPRAEPPHQRHVAVCADLAGPPQPGLDHQRQRHPDEAPVFLDADRLGLHLAQGSRLLHHLCLHGLSLAACPRPPCRHRPLVEAEDLDEGVSRTAMGQQRDHEAHRLGSGSQAVTRRCCSSPGVAREYAERDDVWTPMFMTSEPHHG